MLVINDILSFMQKQGKFKLWSKHARLRTCIKEITKSRNCNPFFRAGISFISQVSSGDRKQKNDSSTPKFEFYLVPGKPYFEYGDYLWGGGFGFGEISKIFGELSTRMNHKRSRHKQSTPIASTDIDSEIQARFSWRNDLQLISSRNTNGQLHVACIVKHQSFRLTPTPKPSKRHFKMKSVMPMLTLLRICGVALLNRISRK